MADVQMFTSVNLKWSGASHGGLELDYNHANWLHVLAQLCSFSWIRIVNVASICEIAGGKKEVKLGRQ